MSQIYAGQKVHELYLRNSLIKQVSHEKASPKQLIKVFDQSDSPVKIVHDHSNQSISLQKSINQQTLNWNKFELEVSLRLVNLKNDVSNCYDQSIEQFIKEKVHLQCEKNYSVAQVKNQVEEYLEQKLSSFMTCDVLELRLGDRLSLPNTAILSSLLKHSNAPVYALVLIADNQDIKKNEFVMKERRDVVSSRFMNQPQQHQSSTTSKSPVNQLETSQGCSSIINNQLSSISTVKNSPHVQSRLLMRLMQDKSQIFAQPIQSQPETERTCGQKINRKVLQSKERMQTQALKVQQAQILQQKYSTSTNFAPRNDEKNKTQALKPSTSNASLKGRVNLIKSLKRSNENDYEEQLDYSQEQNGASSSRSYKSMTSRKFPKVNLSSQAQAKILAKITKHGQSKAGKATTESIESRSRLLATNSRFQSGFNALSPIPVYSNEHIYTSTQFLPGDGKYNKNKKHESSIFNAINRLERLGQTENLTTKQDTDEEYQPQPQPRQNHQRHMQITNFQSISGQNSPKHNKIREFAQLIPDESMQRINGGANIQSRRHINGINQQSSTKLFQLGGTPQKASLANQSNIMIQQQISQIQQSQNSRKSLIKQSMPRLRGILSQEPRLEQPSHASLNDHNRLSQSNVGLGPSDFLNKLSSRNMNKSKISLMGGSLQRNSTYAQAEYQSQPTNIGQQFAQDQGLRKEAAVQATAMIAECAKYQISGLTINDEEIQQHWDDDEVTMQNDQNQIPDCTQAVIILDQMGLYAMTESVIDKINFKNLMHLFICTQLGPQHEPNATLGQRRLLNKIINTLTASKADMVIKEQLGVMMIEQMNEVPLQLKKLIIQLLQKTTRLASFDALTFDWLILLLKCQVGDLVQTTLTVMMDHSDPFQIIALQTNLIGQVRYPLKNSKWNHQRLEWINSLHRHHLKIIEACCDQDFKLNEINLITTRFCGFEINLLRSQAQLSGDIQIDCHGHSRQFLQAKRFSS